MKSRLLVGVGALLLVVGIAWTFQGLGFLGGSVMTGVAVWAVIGPLVAVMGVAMIAVWVRGRRSAP